VRCGNVAMYEGSIYDSFTVTVANSVIIVSPIWCRGHRWGTHCERKTMAMR